MITLTDKACELIQLLAASDPADGAAPGEMGVRIAQMPTADSNTAFGLGLAPGPQPGDTTVEERGARVYLDDTASRALDGRTLDAAVDPTTRQVEFYLT